jgi:hypothetical protein
MGRTEEERDGGITAVYRLSVRVLVADGLPGPGDLITYGGHADWGYEESAGQSSGVIEATFVREETISGVHRGAEMGR